MLRTQPKLVVVKNFILLFVLKILKVHSAIRMTKVVVVTKAQLLLFL